MVRPSELFADFYRLQLTDQWNRWFDQIESGLPLPGGFHRPLPVDSLCNHCPASIWAGFMQPDSLPLLGNDYGDWICVRVTRQDNLGELIHWYHGGGDWIPLGTNIAQAVLHDGIDSFRPKQKQMLRGAVESNRTVTTELPGDTSLADTVVLLSDRLGDSDSAIVAREAWQVLQNQGYISAVEYLVTRQVATEASAGDLIEHYLNLALPDFSLSVTELPEATWPRIGELCGRIIQYRNDLGWCYTLAGLSQQTAGQVETARDTFFASRLTSAFSDQSVRFRTHRFPQRFGKFSIAQLASDQYRHLGEQTSDPYLRLVLNCPENQLIQSVQHYWEELASHADKIGDHEAAYEYWYRAGWDLGAVHLSNYHSILENMANSAQAAGWQGLARVARIHLNCL